MKAKAIKLNSFVPVKLEVEINSKEELYAIRTAMRIASMNNKTVNPGQKTLIDRFTSNCLKALVNFN
jgi:hypothetical protein